MEIDQIKIIPTQTSLVAPNFHPDSIYMLNMQFTHCNIILLMGEEGSGKTFVANVFANSLNSVVFIDGKDNYFHPSINQELNVQQLFNKYCNDVDYIIIDNVTFQDIKFLYDSKFKNKILITCKDYDMFQQVQAIDNQCILVGVSCLKYDQAKDFLSAYNIDEKSIQELLTKLLEKQHFIPPAILVKFIKFYLKQNSKKSCINMFLKSF
jgi:predicted ATP-binding protein involved in virulence